MEYFAIFFTFCFLQMKQKLRFVQRIARIDLYYGKKCTFEFWPIACFAFDWD